MNLIQLLRFVFLNILPSSWMILITLGSVMMYPTFPDWFKLVWGTVVIVQLVMIMRVWDYAVHMSYESFKEQLAKKELENKR